MIKALEHLSYKERLEVLRLLKWKKCPRDIFDICKYLMGEEKKTEPNFSSWDPMTRQEGTNLNREKSV